MIAPAITHTNLIQKLQGEPSCTFNFNEQKLPPLDKTQDRHKPSQPMSGACFNCGKVEHFATECMKPRQRRDHIRAAQTEVPGENLESNHELGEEDNVPSPHKNEYGPDSDVEEIEVNVYDNDYYLRSTDEEHMA